MWLVAADPKMHVSAISSTGGRRLRAMPADKLQPSRGTQRMRSAELYSHPLAQIDRTAFQQWSGMPHSPAIDLHRANGFDRVPFTLAMNDGVPARQIAQNRHIGRSSRSGRLTERNFVPQNHEYSRRPHRPRA